MTGYALDCAFSVIDPVAAKRLGYSGMIRYFARRSSVTAPKIWTKQQIAGCHAAGLWVAGVFEQQATDPLLGHERGVSDCRIAESQWEALGGPDGTVIAYAYDFDADPKKVEAYARGVRETSSGRWPIMAYASDAVFVYLSSRGLVDYFWQTESSGFGGQWPSPRAHLIQHTWYDLRPKLHGDYDENVLHPEVGTVPWWYPQGTGGQTEEEDMYVNLKPGDPDVVIPVRDNATVRFACDSTSTVRFAHGPNAGPTVENLTIPKFTQVVKKIGKAAVVSVINTGGASVGITVDYV